jgi:uncharacterized membrane protein
MIIPPWALLLSFWLHMFATVVWIGGLATLAIIVIPVMRRTLKPLEFSDWLTILNKRLDPIGWLCLGLLIFTGLIQMEDNTNYVGLLAVSNQWSQAIFVKHILFLGMVLVSAYMTWVLAPALQRTAILGARNRKLSTELPSSGRLHQMITINFILGMLVLIFTAIARIS